MKLKSFLKRLILAEEKIDQVFSPVNGEILVYEDLFGKRSMRIGKVSQSGGLVVEIWGKAVNEIYNLKFKIYNCLVLGLGCGNAARLVSQKWPRVKITGIEIDPKVIEVGKKYFGLGEIKNLKIKIADAIKICCRQSAISNQQNYDLVLVDLYLGQNFPKEAESGEFIKGIKNILSEKGIVVFNRFNWGKYKKQVQKFKKELEKYFPQVQTKKIVSNLLIFCQGRYNPDMGTAEFSKPTLELSLAAGLPLTITEKGLRELVSRSVEAGFTKGCVFPFRGFESRHDFEAVSNPNFEIVHIMTPWTPHDVDNGILAVMAGIKGMLLRKTGYLVTAPIPQDGLFPSRVNCEWMLKGLLEAFPRAKLVSCDVDIEFPNNRLLIDIHSGIKLSPEALRDLAQERCFSIIFDPTHILAGEKKGLSASGRPTRVDENWEEQFKIFSDAGLVEVVDISPTPQEEEEILQGKGLWKEITQAAKSVGVGYLRVEIPLHPHWTVNGLRMDKHEQYTSASLYYPPARNEAFEFLRRIGCALKEA